MLKPTIADRYRPDLIGLYVAHGPQPGNLQVFVDPKRLKAWQEGLGKVLLDKLLECGISLSVMAGSGLFFVKGDE
jgi:hypothetical protein